MAQIRQDAKIGHRKIAVQIAGAAQTLLAPNSAGASSRLSQTARSEGRRAGMWVMRAYVGSTCREKAIAAADDFAAAERHGGVEFRAGAGQSSGTRRAGSRTRHRPADGRRRAENCISCTSKGGARASLISAPCRCTHRTGDWRRAGCRLQQQKRFSGGCMISPGKTHGFARCLVKSNSIARSTPMMPRPYVGAAVRLISVGIRCRAALNHAWAEGLHAGTPLGARQVVSERRECSRANPVDSQVAALDQCQRREFRPLLIAALQTGCRYQELAACQGRQLQH